MAPHNDVAAFHEMLRSSPRILGLCGAGLSASSGLPTFRGAGGYWRNYDATDLATPEAFEHDPGLVWLFYNYRRHMALGAQPNAAHRALAALARVKGSDFLCMTQNVDNLSQRANHPPESLRTLHGNLFSIKCSNSRCDWVQHGNFEDPFCPALAPASVDVPLGETLPLLDPNYALEPIPRDQLPKCPQCRTGLQRPGVVWFGELLDEDVLSGIDKWIDEWFENRRTFKLMLVIGTSAQVGPASVYLDEARMRGATIVNINPEAEDPEEMAKLEPGDFAFAEDAAAFLPLLLEPLIGTLQEDGEYRK